MFFNVFNILKIKIKKMYFDLRKKISLTNIIIMMFFHLIVFNMWASKNHLIIVYTHTHTSPIYEDKVYTHEQDSSKNRIAPSLFIELRAVYTSNRARPLMCAEQLNIYIGNVLTKTLSLQNVCHAKFMFAHIYDDGLRARRVG